MVYGLGAALGWGLADLAVALISRRVGSFATVLYLKERPAPPPGVGVAMVLGGLALLAFGQ